MAEVTRIDASEIRDDTGFFDLGMDSLMAVELHRRLERGFGRQLPVTLAMDHPRLADAAEYLLGRRARPRAHQAPAQPDAVATVRIANEPIAIVGLACRFPGARDAEAFWDVLSGGVDVIREIPDDRFDIDEYYDPDPDAAGKIYTRYGGFLDEIDGFDPEFFGISPREAVWIDPQQRLVLETAWEGLERAGYCACGVARQQKRRVRGRRRQRVLARVVQQLLERHRSPVRHRQCHQRHRGSGGLRARTGRPGGGCWTPRAARRWLPSIRRARRCTPATAIWRWPVG